MKNASTKKHAGQRKKSEDAGVTWVRELIGAYAAAREEGSAQKKGAAQRALLSCVLPGYYKSPIDLVKFKPSAEAEEIGILGVAKNEVTHEFSVIVLRRQDACFPVPLLQFMRVISRLSVVRTAPPCDIYGDFMASIAGRARLGKYEHISSTKQRPREYHLIGSLVQPVDGGEIVLAHECGSPFREGLRVRDGYGGNRAFHSRVNRDEGRGERFRCIRKFKGPEEALDVIRLLQ